jgi:hypothetical protein
MSNAAEQSPQLRCRSRQQRNAGSRPEVPLLWIPTAEASVRLGISRKTLFRLKKQGVLKQEHHWSRKNPTRRCSDLLWHLQRCQLALGRI